MKRNYSLDIVKLVFAVFIALGFLIDYLGNLYCGLRDYHSSG